MDQRIARALAITSAVLVGIMSTLELLKEIDGEESIKKIRLAVNNSKTKKRTQD